MFGFGRDEEEQFDPLTGAPKAVEMPAQASAPSAQPMNPVVQDYIAKKFNLGQYTDENRQKLMQDSGPDMSDRAAAMLSAIGAGFSGGDAGAAGNAVLNRAKAAKDQKLADFDRARAAKIQEYELDKSAAGDDALSGDSKAYAEQIGALFPAMRSVVAGKSKAQIEAMMPLLTAKIKGQVDRDNKALDHKFDMQKLGAQLNAEKAKKDALANTEKGKFDALPNDKQLTITELAKKNANKTSIMNQIDAVMAGWDKLSDDQKVTTGRTLLKTLNSTEGADAIGAEEAKRLGAKLEFAMGNIFNSNPTQFGRDLKGFADQARNASSTIKSAIKANQDQIDTAYGRPSKPSPGKVMVSNGKETLMIDASDVAAAEADGFRRVGEQVAGK